MTTNVDMVVDADDFGEPLLFGRLLELAQNVLSGRGEQGLLAGITEPDRSRFASALWLEGAAGASMEFWVHNLCNLLADNGIDQICLEIDDESICPCGRPLGHHVEPDGMGIEGRGIALEGQSRALHLYTSARGLDPVVRDYRSQARFEHPRLLDVVIQEAYGARLAGSRRAEAWRVLDAIDHRQSLIGALAGFFRVGPAAIRAMCHWRPESPQFWLTYPSARRVASVLAMLPVEKRAELAARELWRWLAVAHVVIRSTSIPIDYLIRTQFLDGIERFISVKPVKRQDLRSRIRQTVRWLRLERRQHGGLPRPSRLLSAIGVPVPPSAILNYCFALPDGWVGAPLDTPEAIREEGASMHHCLGRFVKDVMRGDEKAYTLRSSDHSERATLVTRLWPLNDEGGEALSITLTGMDNGPVHVGALEATLALIRIVAPSVSHVQV